jgi:hypothetical protein|tara:strand:+ start:1635 stop:1889 length:255 start_codon:yes stop_codon:yes gene_type:complete
MILLTELNKQLSSLNVSDLNLTKDYINDLIAVKVKSTLKVGSNVNIVQKTKKTPGVITKMMRSNCLVKCKMTTYRVPMRMLEAA